jgi:regulatory protein
VPTITALRSERRGRVAVELDGSTWRTLPADAVVRAGLSVGRTLERADLRLLRREVRRAEALATASRALRARDHSRQQLVERLARADVAPATREESLEVLTRAGFVDDARVAASRARALAERGYGDEAIRLDLERKGIVRELIEDALSELADEVERVNLVVARRGASTQTARYLAGRGFAADTVESAVAAESGEE